MRQVASLIAEGDESTTIESDDLLQCDCVYGGLFDPEAKRFGFRYFHSDDRQWDIVLNASQIGEIANGSLKRLELWRCADSACGCLYATEDSYCPHCDSIRDLDSGYANSLRVWHPDEPASGIDSLANLRQIVLAILDYVSANHGRMPPPYTTNEHGDCMHSWRSLILPFLDLDELYDDIDFTQPWDASANFSLAARIPEAFRSPNTRPGHTRYSAVLGPRTLWPATGMRMVSDVKSGYSNTIAVVETPRSEIQWMSPYDIDVETLAKEVASCDGSLLAALVDGNATALGTFDAAQIRDLATI